MSIENKFLSQLIDEGDFTVCSKANVTEADFLEQADIFRFIKQYKKTYNVLPTLAELTGEYPHFLYLPSSGDNLLFTAKKLKSDNAKRRAYELLQKEASPRFNAMNGTDFINWLHEETSKIKAVSNVELSLGSNFATNGAERKEIYLDSKENRTFQYVPTPYPTLTENLGGGFEIGDYVLLQSYTNRGKSWISSQIGLTAYNNGFGVLHYSPELSTKQQLQRLDTLNQHFKNSDLRVGQLANEEQYFNYLEKFNDTNETPYLVKTMSDLPQGLSLEVLEADLQANPTLKLVIIDGLNLMTHKGNDGTRNNISNTSRKLRQIFAKYEVVGVVVHQISTQAEKENRTEGDEGQRMPSPAKIHQYSESIAMIQDASVVLNFDSSSNLGLGKILLAKCRTPNVDSMIDLHINFNEGFIYEASAVDYI